MDFTLISIFFVGVVIGFVIGMLFYLRSQKRLKEYQRKLEKTSVQSSEDTSRVAVLESKIEVLEKALKSALEKNE